MRSGDRESSDGADTAAHPGWGNAQTGGGFNIAHVITIFVATLFGYVATRFIDRSDPTQLQISMAHVETEVTTLKSQMDRLLAQPIELRTDHLRDVDDVRATEARDIERLEARLDQLEQHERNGRR